MVANIIIIGITGVGKTTIGKVLSEKLGKTFIDLDKSIESRCGVDISTIFAIEGEQGFRERETDELNRAIINNANYILSIGGGCITRSVNRSILAKSSNLVIQLYANTETLVERLAKSITKRPMFDNQDIEKKVTELYNSRKDDYEKVTDLKIDTSELRPNQVADIIIQQLQTLKISSLDKNCCN